MPTQRQSGVLRLSQVLYEPLSNSLSPCFACIRVPRSFAEADRALNAYASSACPTIGSSPGDATKPSCLCPCCCPEANECELVQELDAMIPKGDVYIVRKQVVLESIGAYHCAMELLGLVEGATAEVSEVAKDAVADHSIALQLLLRSLQVLQPQESEPSSYAGSEDENEAEEQYEGKGVNASWCQCQSSSQMVPADWCERSKDWSVALLVPESMESCLCGARNVILDVELLCHPLVTMYPDIRWMEKLNKWCHKIVALMNSNYLLQTLGGGHFCCRQAPRAIELAQAQRRVAQELGDKELAGKCTVNEAYSYIWLGEYAKASAILNGVLKGLEEEGEAESHLRNYASIALNFLGQAERANATLHLTKGTPYHPSKGSPENENRSKEGKHMLSSTFDDFFRVRAVTQ
ncbi:unnamed protein product [Chrysoparadoxa australica]